MNKLNLSRRSWEIIIGFFLLIILAAAAWYFYRNSSENGTEGNKSQERAELQSKQIDNAVIPAGLPSNLPSEPGTKVLKNYESAAPDGRKQSTRAVTSNEQPRAALEIYIKFFKSLGYQGSYDSKNSVEGGLQIARFVKDNNVIMLVASPYMDKDQKKEITQVEISLLY